jgi:hypothetical protein
MLIASLARLTDPEVATRTLNSTELCVIVTSPPNPQEVLQMRDRLRWLAFSDLALADQQPRALGTFVFWIRTQQLAQVRRSFCMVLSPHSTLSRHE